MAKISKKSESMPASAIRKLVPFADAAKAEGVKVYHLNVGQPDIKSPECALEAVKKNTLDHVSYSNSAGLIELRKGLVDKYYRKIGIDIDVPELIVTVAGSEGVNLSLQITCDEGDEVIVLEPFYTNYNTFAFMNGITLKAVHTDIRNGFKVPDMAEFEKLITPRTKAILISNPGNPTGTLYTKENMLALGEVAKKHDLFLISDEVYREFCYTDEPHFSAMNIPGLEQNVILIDSVSKRYNLCGCRIGCIVSHNADVMKAAMKYAQARLCPPIYGQLAAIGALDTPKEYFDAVISVDSYNYFGRDKSYLDDKLLPHIKGGGYVYIAIPGMKKDCHDNLPPELLLSWTPEQMDYMHDVKFWAELVSASKLCDVIEVAEMQSNDEVWADWLRQENEYAVGDRKSMEAGAGKYLNFIKIILRKKQS